MTEGSIERLLLHLRRLPALATPPAGTAGACRPAGARGGAEP